MLTPCNAYAAHTTSTPASLAWVHASAQLMSSWCASEGTPPGRRRHRLPPHTRRALSLALLLTTLSAAAFGGDDFFLASPGVGAGSDEYLRPDAGLAVFRRPSSAAIHSLSGRGAALGVRRRSAAGCWRGLGLLSNSAITISRRHARVAVALLGCSSRQMESQLVAAWAAWPGLRLAARTKLTIVGVRLGAACARAGRAARHDWRMAAAAARAAAAAADDEAQRLRADPTIRITSYSRCVCYHWGITPPAAFDLAACCTDIIDVSHCCSAQPSRK